MAGVWTAATKVKRELAAKREMVKAQKKFETYDARKAAAEAEVAKYTPEEFEARKKRFEDAKARLEWNRSAPVDNQAEYDRLIAEATAEDENGDDAPESSDDE